MGTKLCYDHNYKMFCTFCRPALEKGAKAYHWVMLAFWAASSMILVEEGFYFSVSLKNLPLITSNGSMRMSQICPIMSFLGLNQGILLCKISQMCHIIQGSYSEHEPTNLCQP